MQKKGNVLRGIKPSKSFKCKLGKNKNTGKCLKYPRKK